MNSLDQFELTEILWASELIRKTCDLGQSFAFDRTRIWPDANFPTVRISGGCEDENKITVLAREFHDIISQL